MKCVICKNGTTRKGTTTITLERGGSIVIIKNVPAQVCQNCGEPYTNSETSKAVLKKANDAIKKGAELEVLRYSA